jgi:C-methyltransferase C-terminal domain/Putative zinc binding domain/Methyltransferase domain
MARARLTACNAPAQASNGFATGRVVSTRVVREEHQAMYDGALQGVVVRCRSCGAGLTRTFVDLGSSPLCETQIRPSDLNKMEPFYPLHVFVCDQCFLVQLDEYVSPDTIFNADYPYFSSYSTSWVAHARDYAEHMQTDHGIGAESFVVEIASNDGYLLQHFAEKGVRCLGVEPSAGVANAAIAKGVPTVVNFFGAETAAHLVAQHGKADLLIGNNVLAHVPQLNDFVNGLRVMLADDGVITLEFPHLLRLMQSNQFDTIYHEHFSYFSFTVVNRLLARHDLVVVDVAELSTHGGSLRIYAAHKDGRRERSKRVLDLLERERSAGVETPEFYSGFETKVRETKWKLLQFMIDARRRGKSIVGYGAPGKGNTLLNYCGIRRDLLEYTVDRNPHKQGTYTPGTRIPILDPSQIDKTRPDFILILPWNLRDEIVASMSHVRRWGARFVVPIPEVEVID